jgi:hypothetical protein
VGTVDPKEKGMKIAIALALVAGIATVASTAGAANRLNPCSMLSAGQVAAVHVDTSCKLAVGKPNAYYYGVSGTWGELGGKGSVIVAIDHMKSHSYIALWKTDHPAGKSWGVGSWSRGTCTSGGSYCFGSFVVGDYAVTIQIAPPAAKPISVTKPTIAMAKTIAAKLS